MVFGNHGSRCSALRTRVCTNPGARQTYSAAFAFPHASSVLMYSTAAATEKLFLVSVPKLLGNLVQMAASRFFSLAQSPISGGCEISAGRRTQPIFLITVPSRQRRSQMASSTVLRLLRHQATTIGEPLSSSSTSVRAPCRLVDIRENSILSSGPSYCHGSSCCLSNSGLSSHKREPQPRMAIFMSFSAFQYATIPILSTSPTLRKTRDRLRVSQFRSAGRKNGNT